MNYVIEYRGFCLQGKVKHNNEDNMYCNGMIIPRFHQDVEEISGECKAESGAWFALFDGIGGEPQGETASYLSAGSFRNSIGKTDSPFVITQDMNKTVCNYMKENGIKAMGNTVVAVQFTESAARGFNLGDSRCYCLSDNIVDRMSEDHLAYTPYTGGYSLTQCIGVPEEDYLVEPHMYERSLEDGQILMMCTDGITKDISDNTLRRIVSKNSSIHDMVEELKEAYNSRGAQDDATVLFFQIREVQ